MSFLHFITQTPPRAARLKPALCQKGTALIPDQEFANPRLAEIYDYLDSDRSDLDHYVTLIENLNVNSVLDIGCGTGSLLCLLAGRGLKLCGVDPAAASLAVSRRKAGSEKIEWVLADAESLPEMGADVALMTGNVAQVFLEDRDWLSALSSIRRAISPTGYLIFESRDPTQRAWEGWNRTATLTRTLVPKVGFVTSWVELIEVKLPMVTFRWSYKFEKDNSFLTSESTLCFRSQSELELSLVQSGYRVVEVRDAPDRPGKEFVFIAKVVNEEST